MKVSAGDGFATSMTSKGQVKESVGRIVKRAQISRCEKYRYRLTRYWGPGHMMPFVMLNPSTANADLDDPTIRRCMGFARREGAGGIVVANLYAYRATKPVGLREAVDPTGPGNFTALDQLAAEAVGTNMPIVCAWGSQKFMRGQAAQVARFQEIGARLVCLGKTADGSPRHPLYVLGAAPLVSYP